MGLGMKLEESPRVSPDLAMGQEVMGISPSSVGHRLQNKNKKMAGVIIIHYFVQNANAHSSTLSAPFYHKE